MTNFSIKITKSLITDCGTFSTGDNIIFVYKDEVYMGVITDLDDVNERLFVNLLNSNIIKSVFEIKDIEKISLTSLLL